MSADLCVHTAIHPREHLDRLRRPGRHAPVRRHLAWHEQSALLWDAMAALEPVLADNARRLAEFHRSEAARLVEMDPDLPDDAEW